MALIISAGIAGCCVEVPLLSRCLIRAGKRHFLKASKHTDAAANPGRPEPEHMSANHRYPAIIIDPTFDKTSPIPSWQILVNGTTGESSINPDRRSCSIY
jgi:hypothetical protein